MNYNPQIDPLFKRGTHGAAALLLHGFTGTPDSMRPTANRLHEAGFTVFAPLLSGHGRTSDTLAQTGWKEWYETARNAFEELITQHDKVFVCGLSLGGLLTLKLCHDLPEKIKAASCLATPLYLARWVKITLPLMRATPLRHFWKYQKKLGPDIKDPQAKMNFWNNDLMPLSCIKSIMDFQRILVPELTNIHTPLLLMHSRYDSTAPYNSMNRIAAKVTSSITETVTLENSYHVITIDYEKELVAQKVTDFFKRFL
jgi:carboxylesterase